MLEIFPNRISIFDNDHSLELQTQQSIVLRSLQRQHVAPELTDQERISPKQSKINLALSYLRFPTICSIRLGLGILKEATGLFSSNILTFSEELCIYDREITTLNVMEQLSILFLSTSDELTIAQILCIFINYGLFLVHFIPSSKETLVALPSLTKHPRKVALFCEFFQRQNTTPFFETSGHITLGS
ncbi:hypothetical protein BLNAU_2805 [Blattamonas nauphoetae]|uniref:Uncharacterized protein n=1 Tax=Blattamonas nauphoetae TaxID=2049346 RepID=A0ABQ9YEJ5_9EUKA|nr:hypothetical protein BLNAU_2805 [Blattamonas nauphoetae]